MSKKGNKSKPEIKLPVTKQEKTETKIIEEIDFFNNLNNNAVWFLTALLVLICFIVFKDYLFLQKVYYFKDIRSDSYNFSFPTLNNTASYISQHGIPKWSFSSGMGQNIFPLMFRDPFDIILYIGGQKNLSYLIVYVEVFKIILSGIVFFYYLKTLHLSTYINIIGALLFAFCGFMTEGSCWYVFSFDAFTIALMLLAFEQLFTNNKWFLFPIVIFLIGISMPFNLYINGLFLALYAVLRHLQIQKLDLKKLSLLYLKMFGLGIIGLLLAGPFLIENIYQLLESPRVGGTNSLTHILAARPAFAIADKLQIATCILRFFSNDILGSGNDFKGWMNILEAPMFYCGLPCLVLVPQVFPALEKRIRYTFIVFISIWLLPILFPYLRLTFWLFTGDYYRAYSFFVAVFFIYFSVVAFELIIKTRKINLIILISTLLLLIILLNYPYFEEADAVDLSIRFFANIFLIAYSVLLFFIGRNPKIQNLKYAFLVLIFVEICFLSYKTANTTDPETQKDTAVSQTELNDKIGYNDYTCDAVNYLKKIDKSFYRIDKAYFSGISKFGTLDDAQAQNYYGTCSYNTFNQLYYINYLQLTDVAKKENENDSRWARGLNTRPILECENRVKYYLAKQQNFNPIWQIIGDTIARFGDVKIFRSKIVLPFGYTYSHYLKESVYQQLSSAQKDFVSLNTCVVKDNDITTIQGLTEFSLKDTLSVGAFNLDTLFKETNELKKDSLVVSKFEETNIIGTIQLNETKIMYLSIPYDEGWSLTVDGKPQKKLILSAGMTGILLNKGTHNIEMKYELRFYSKGLLMSIIGIILLIGLFIFTKRTIKHAQ